MVQETLEALAMRTPRGEGAAIRGPPEDTTA